MDLEPSTLAGVVFVIALAVLVQASSGAGWRRARDRRALPAERSAGNPGQQTVSRLMLGTRIVVSVIALAVAVGAAVAFYAWDPHLSWTLLLAVVVCGLVLLLIRLRWPPHHHD